MNHPTPRQLFPRPPRDPARIDRLLAALRDYWHACPDLRLTQLLVGLIPDAGPCPRVFSFEDDRLLARLEGALNEQPLRYVPHLAPRNTEHAP